jgi:glutamate/tyrosine decarboxylase-like PLP-dependent enzyme
MAFPLHADAAWGGYAAAATRSSDGGRRPWPEVQRDGWPDRDVYDALCALERTDSVTIDPHKLGFVPYPAGAVCFRDRRVRALSTSDAPYVFHAHQGEHESIGRYILEGSRPGAAAAAVWMAHRACPLDGTGYGRLIRDTVLASRRLHQALADADLAPYRAVLLPESDLNIVCFSVTGPGLDTLERTNAFVDRVYERFTPNTPEGRANGFFLSRTSLRAHEYGDAALPTVAALGFTAQDYRRAGEVTVLRSTVMKPFPEPARGKPHLVDQFIAALKRTLGQALAE